MREVIIKIGGQEIFAQRISVRQSEFFAAGQQDMKPEHCFKVRDCEYSGEDTLDYDGVKLVIYRTYETGDYIELYTTKKAGVR